VKNYKHEYAEIEKGARELAIREMHPLRVYRPMPQQLPLHEASAGKLVARGGRRAGKTVAVACEFASRILGVPITRADGTVIPLKYPVSTKADPRLYWIIAFDVNHIGQTIYERLFEPGMGPGCGFRIIEQDGQWRSFNPNTDQPRYGESRLAPPLIPDYLIDQNSWHMESAAGKIFKAVSLTNGARICAYPSTGDHAKQGDAVDGIWIDEDVANENFVEEYYARLSSRRGWFMWSAYPQLHNEALLTALGKAEEFKDDPDPPIQAFNMAARDNEYSDKAGIRESLMMAKDEDEYRHWDEGDIEHLMGNVRMYDFSPAIHVVQPLELKEATDPLTLFEKLLQDLGQFPADWTRYLAIDPSHTRTACLFGVVPPPDYDNLRLGDRLIVERELIVKRHTPAMFADALKPLVQNLRFEAFVMDQQIGKQTTVGNDRTVFQSYEREFVRIGLYSRMSKHGFMRGCNDKALRRRTVRMMLEPTLDGLPRLLFCGPRTFLTQKEFYSYRKKQLQTSSGPILLDDPINERQCDAMASLEYLCQFVAERMEQHEAWRAPEEFTPRPSGAWLAAQEINKREASNYVHLGPGAAA
jgi:hypothetical protein